MSEVLVLRSCSSSMTSRDGFIWPSSGPVEAPDWDGGRPVCGGKLHGFLWGEGDGRLANWNPDARWLVVAVPADEIINLGGKVGFRRGEVVFCGDRLAATDYLIAHGASGKAVIGATVSSGYRGTSTSGDYGISTSGDRGISTSGDYGTSTSGYSGTSTSGDNGTSTSGKHGTSTSGYRGTSTSGYHGTSTSLSYGTSTSGDSGTSNSSNNGTSNSGDDGTSTSGDFGTSTSGDRGTSTSGICGTSISGIGGEIRIRWHDGTRYRTAVGYVGEGGIEPHTAYVVRGNGVLTKQEPFVQSRWL